MELQTSLLRGQDYLIYKGPYPHKFSPREKCYPIATQAIHLNRMFILTISKQSLKLNSDLAPGRVFYQSLTFDSGPSVSCVTTEAKDEAPQREIEVTTVRHADIAASFSIATSAAAVAKAATTPTIQQSAVPLLSSFKCRGSPKTTWCQAMKLSAAT
ncbi:hypothetical protein DPMN_019796 [Dreissena polymorpha]|uniref:Uncharacterized protein n=1 Tax=Dreissena polymorpha TaxID=45954 RepID=A0A9D4NJY3_DREPO|nr:hypothetical protein DPMN_019796 [Dreissena polymorpha]